jgi:hypothetical protein
MRETREGQVNGNGRGGSALRYLAKGTVPSVARPWLAKEPLSKSGWFAGWQGVARRTLSPCEKGLFALKGAGIAVSLYRVGFKFNRPADLVAAAVTAAAAAVLLGRATISTTAATVVAASREASSVREQQRNTHAPGQRALSRGDRKEQTEDGDPNRGKGK